MIRYVVLSSSRIELARFVSLGAVAVYLQGATDDVVVLAQEADVVRPSTPYRPLHESEKRELE